jgi:hypothetical protein
MGVLSIPITMVPEDRDVVGGERKAGSYAADTTGHIDFRLRGRQENRAAAAREKYRELVGLTRHHEITHLFRWERSSRRADGTW